MSTNVPAFEAVQDVPVYEANSSDESEDEPVREESVMYTPPPPPQMSKYVSSNFQMNDQNTVFLDQSVIFGLKNQQTLILRGQFTLEVIRGALDINGVIYHSNADAMTFINPVSNSLPVFQATQVIDSSLLDNRPTPESSHLFTPDYKSVVRASNLFTGLEAVGRLCPLFKNMFWNPSNLFPDDVNDLDDNELRFSEYSFFPCTKPDNSISTIMYKQWLRQLQQLSSLHSQDKCLRVVVVGGKNSGKSTFLRLLVQHMLAAVPINLLDLDPGQPEYSKPDCISLSKLHTLQHGNHLSLTSTEQVNHYIGFTSPKDQPKRYNALVEDLIRQYESDGQLKNESMLVNTPGWIKGYGLELTRTLLQRVNPTHIVYLNSGTADLDLIVPDTTELITLQGSYQGQGRYSSAQMRILKTMAYFHKIQNFQFDFQPVLFTPPLQVTYSNAQGVSAVTLLGTSVKVEHLERAIEGTILAVYTVKTTYLDQVPVTNKDNVPFLDQQHFMSIPAKFRALAMIHSIDTANKIMNLYIPQFEQMEVKPGYTTILVRGHTELPIWEMASNEVIKKFKRDIPYISFEKSTAYDKLWKSRKNVQRRGQQ